jgi:serine protease SohB
MEVGLEVLGFFAKSVVVFFLIGGLIALVAFLAARGREASHLEVTDLTERFNTWTQQLKIYTLSPAMEKIWLKEERKKEKKRRKSKDLDPSRRVFVIDFTGDMKASLVDHLRDEITVILKVADKDRDEVVIRLESPGGVVHGYGLAASQLQRVRREGLKLTVCVDKVAASGGYMMACVAHQIVAAPFAILGSIGVLAQVPNFHRLLKKNNVDYEEITAGEYKRTMSLFGEITGKGREKFAEQIEETHDLFKTFVQENRPNLDVQSVSTGEYWYGRKAIELGLADLLLTSDEYLFGGDDAKRVLLVRMKGKKNWPEKLGQMMERLRSPSTLERLLP